MKPKKNLVKDKKGVVAIFNMLITIGISIAVIFVIFGVVIPQIGDQSEDTMDLSAYAYSTANTVTNESFTSDHDVYVALAHSPIQSGSETISNSTTSFTSSNITSTITNESFAGLNTSYTQLNNTEIDTGEIVYNSSINPFLNIDNANYTMNYTDGSVILNTTGIIVNGTYYINYTYNNVKDYTMNYTDGKIMALSTGDISDATATNASYTYGTQSNWYYIQTNMSSNVLSWVGSVNLVVIISLLALVIMAVAGMMVYRGRGGEAGGI